MKLSRFRQLVFTASAALCLFGSTVHAQVPQLINYQGRVAVSGTNFSGSGQFKFALVSGSAPNITYWSNDGTSTAGSAPASAVSLTVANGLYSVLLGDTTVANMTEVPATVFANSDVRLRVWLNDGTHGWQQLTPDQRIAAVGYALVAESVPDGSITMAKIAPGALVASQISGLSPVATSGSYGSLSDLPTIPTTLPATGGTAATISGTIPFSQVTGVATALQGARADSAIQPNTLATLSGVTMASGSLSIGNTALMPPSGIAQNSYAANTGTSSTLYVADFRQDWTPAGGYANKVGAGAVHGSIFIYGNSTIDALGSTAAFLGVATNRGSGPVGNIRGFESHIGNQCDNYGGANGIAVSECAGFFAEGPVTSGSNAPITNSYGFYSKPQKSSGVTNAYGFRQVGANDQNVFDGSFQANSIKSTTSITSGIGSAASPGVNIGGINGGCGFYTQNGIDILISSNGSNIGNLSTTGLLTTTGGVTSTAIKATSNLTVQTSSGAAGILLKANAVGNNKQWLLDQRSDSQFEAIYWNGSAWITMLLISETGDTTIAGGVTIGGGTKMKEVMSATATLDFPAIAAASQADLAITVTGATVGDVVSIGLPAAPDAGLVYNAFVSASNTVTVRASNITGSVINPAAATYRAQVTKF